MGGSIEDDGSHQLRRHPIEWRAISTCEATRLLLLDMENVHVSASNTTASSSSLSSRSNQTNQPPRNRWQKMKQYQSLANRAAQKQLGRPRVKEIHEEVGD